MAHTAILKVECEKGSYSVIECNYEFVKPIKENGQPDSHVAGGLIHLTIVTPDNDATFLHEWLKNTNEHRDGEIVFTVVNEKNPSVKTLRFERAYCIRLQEYFNSHNEEQMLTSITISASEMIFGSTKKVKFTLD